MITMHARPGETNGHHGNSTMTRSNEHITHLSWNLLCKVHLGMRMISVYFHLKKLELSS